jgi:hypothetical protein
MFKLFKSFNKLKKSKHVQKEDAIEESIKDEENEIEESIQDENNNFDEMYREEHLSHIKELSSEEKEVFIINYEDATRRMEHENNRMFSLIKIFIEKDINRPLALEEIRQIREKFSGYDKDIYDTVMSIF